MCGIAGVVSAEGNVQLPLLRAMAEAMAHRGPDADGTWQSPDGRAGLAHRRLSILDLSLAGRQPMGNADGSIQVTFNGEIYNYLELRRWLEGRGHQFRSKTDTEVLVYLYEEEQERMVSRLDGDFAFGIWDCRRRRLFLARDPAGVKPLYHCQIGGDFLFASEIKALLQHPVLPRRVDEEALYHYLTYLMVPAPKSLFEGIEKLAAGSTATLQLHPDGQTSFSSSKYWEPLPGLCDVDSRAPDEQLSELFERSVKKRLMADVPVGVLFSGGVDSVLNTAMFGRLISPKKVRTFTVGMGGTARYEDESTRARAMAQVLDSEHYEVQIGEKDLLDSVASVIRHLDEPIADPVSVPLLFVTKLARERGMTVLHAGEGADEIFCGYGTYRRILNRHRRLWRPVSALPSVAPAIGFRVLRQFGRPRLQKMAEVLRMAALGQEPFMSSAVAFYEDEKSRVLAPGFRRRHSERDSFDVVRPLYRRLNQSFPEATFLQRLTFLELQIRLPELLLMRVDKMSMANSVEVRVPFLDRELVEFALSVPDSFKLRNGVSKEPVKRLAAQFVDHAHVYGPKRGFGVPIQDWFGARLGEELRELLQNDRSELSQFFDIDAVLSAGSRPPGTVNRAFQLWTIYNFSLWHRELILTS